jgi:hypothetical protein
MIPVHKATRAALESLRNRFTGKPALVFAPGPSLTKLWNGHVTDLPKIAVGNAYVHVPDADILYHTDCAWWSAYQPKFGGLKLCYEAVLDHPGVFVVEGTGDEGYDPSLGHVRNGNNSGYVGAHIAAQLGANPIVLVAYDMHPDHKGRNHYFGEHPDNLARLMPYDSWVEYFNGLHKALKKIGVDLLSCTPGSALTGPYKFPRGDRFRETVGKLPFVDLEQILGSKS